MKRTKYFSTHQVCELLLHLTTKDSDLYTRIMKLFTDDITRCLIDQLGNQGNSSALLGLLHVLLPDLCENSQDNRDLLIRSLTSNLGKIIIIYNSSRLGFYCFILCLDHCWSCSPTMHSQKYFKIR